MTALIFATKNGKKEIVEILLSAGADINIQDKVATYLFFASISLIFKLCLRMENQLKVAPRQMKLLI